MPRASCSRRRRAGRRTSATERTLLEGLRDNPYIRPVTLDQLFTSVPAATRDDEPVVRSLAPHTPAPFPVSAAAYSTAQEEQAALQSTVGANDPDDRGRRAGPPRSR